MARLFVLIVVSLALFTTSAVDARSSGKTPPFATSSADSLLLGAVAEGLVWTTSPDVHVAGPGHAVGLRWDLGSLDRARVRSDLVTISMRGHRGAGAVRLWGYSPFGQPEVVLDRADGAAVAVLQVGRSGHLFLTFDASGDHTLTVDATVPATGGGELVAHGDLRVIVGAGAVAPSPGALDLQPVAGAGFASTGTAEQSRSAPGLQASVIGAPAPSAMASSVRNIGEGHVDIGPRFVDGAWKVQMKDDATSPAIWRELDEVVLRVGDAARVEVPAGSAYAFLGAPGSAVHVLPQAQRSGIVWPGWNTQDPSVVARVPGSVTWRLRSVDGPGRFLLYVAGTFGSTDVIFDSAEPLPQGLEIAHNVHVHGNWAFTAPGAYRLTVEMAATGSGGESFADTRVLTFAVGDAPAAQAGVSPPAAPVPDASRATVAPSTTGDARPATVAGATASRPAGSMPVTGGSATRGLIVLGLGALALGSLLVEATRVRRLIRSENQS